MSVTYNLWPTVTDQLKIIYNDHYLTYERSEEENPLALLVPKVDQFFGPKILNIFIVGQPYEWPHVDLEAAKTKHKELFEKFTKYKTLIWMDFNIVNLVMADSPASNFRDQMIETEGHIEDLCEELADFGFEYMGRIETAVEASYFQEYLDTFYGVDS